MIVRSHLIPRLRLLLVGAMLAILAVPACADLYKMIVSGAVDGQGNIVFKLKLINNKSAPINDIRVFGVTNGVWDYQHALWSMSAESGSYLNVSEVTYGKSLTGFHSTPAAPLAKGNHYVIGIVGAGISEAYEFETNEHEGTLSINILGHATARPR